MDAATREAIRRQVDAAVRARVPMPSANGARYTGRTLAAWDAADGDPLLALALVLDVQSLHEEGEPVKTWQLSCGHTVPNA